MDLEMRIIEWFQLHRTRAFDAAMAVFSFLSKGYVAIFIAGVIAGYLLKIHRKKEALILFGGTLFGAALELVLKYGFGRARPPLPHQIPGYSFPSGHVLCSTVFIVFLVQIGCQFRPRRKALYYSLASMVLVGIGLNRVYIGAHWPSDVLAGYVMGLILVVLWSAFVQRVWNRFNADTSISQRSES